MAVKLPPRRFPRVLVFTSVIPTKSSRVPTHMYAFWIGVVELFIITFTILTKLSFCPSENVFWKTIAWPDTLNILVAVIAPYPTVFVVSLLPTINCE
jgi:hypothetical protein